MKVLHSWLQEYFTDPLPAADELADKFSLHAFEVEGVEGTGPDAVIDIDVLPNRAHDCLCHRGVAKELSVILDRSMEQDPLREELPERKQADDLSVTIDNPVHCRRFSGAVVANISVGPSPEWLKSRLEALGQKSINNVVDITNYVMLALGQPLHAFDADKIEGGDTHIRVRMAQAGERITTLDGEERELSGEDLLITDGTTDAPIGIAGVKGGAAAEIHDGTTAVIIEAANFKPTMVRKTAQRLRLRTDASTRFENEPSPELTRYALELAIGLLEEHAGGKCTGVVDEYPQKPAHAYTTGVSLGEINSLLGTELAKDDVANIFERFGFAYKAVDPVARVLETARSLEGRPYTYGASVSFDAPETFDCSSFVAYCFAQAGVSLPRMAIDQYVFGEPVEEGDLAPGDVVFARNGNPQTHTFTYREDGSEIVHEGAKEVSEEFMPGTAVPGGVSHNGIYLGEDRIIHADPAKGVVVEQLRESDKFTNIVGYRRMVSPEERFVVTVPFERMDLRRPEDLIEEVGRIHGYWNVAVRLPKKLAEPDVHKEFAYMDIIRRVLIQHGFSEVYTPALRAEGEIATANPLASDKSHLRPRISEGLREALAFNARNADLLALPDVRIFEIGKVFPKSGEHTALAFAAWVPGKKGGRQAEVILNDARDALGDVLGVEVPFQISDGVVEVNFDALIEKLPVPEQYEAAGERSTVAYQPFSVYPFVLRDIAVWVSEGTNAADLLAVIREAAGDLLVNWRLFDEYHADGRTSYAYRLVFQSYEKTLSDAEVNEIMQQVETAVTKRGWEVR